MDSPPVKGASSPDTRAAPPKPSLPGLAVYLLVAFGLAWAIELGPDISAANDTAL